MQRKEGIKEKKLFFRDEEEDESDEIIVFRSSFQLLCRLKCHVKTRRQMEKETEPVSGKENLGNEGKERAKWDLNPKLTEEQKSQP